MENMMGILNIFANFFGSSVGSSAPQTPEQRVEEQMAEMNKWLSKHKAFLNEGHVDDEHASVSRCSDYPGDAVYAGNTWSGSDD